MQQRKTLKAQGSALRQANVFVVVDVNARGVQHPVGQPVGAGLAFAGGVAGLVHRHVGAVNKVRPCGFAMGAVLRKFVAGRGEKALKGVHFQLQIGALVNIAIAPHPHVAGGARRVGGHVVVQPVGADDGAGLAQLGVALQRGVLVGAAGQAVALQEHGCAAHLLGAQGLARGRRWGILRCGGLRQRDPAPGCGQRAGPPHRHPQAGAGQLGGRVARNRRHG